MAVLNLLHPLAQGLLGCWRFDAGSGDTIQDLTIGNRDFSVGPGYSWIVDPTLGPGLTLSTDVPHIVFPADAGRTGITVAVVAKMPDSTWWPFYSLSVDYGMGPPCFWSGIRGDDFDHCYTDLNPASTIPIDTGVVGLFNTPYIWSTSLSALADSYQMWVNGTKYTTPNAAQAIGNMTILALNAAIWDPAGNNKTFWLVCLWDRQLSDAEQLSFNSSPYDMFGSPSSKRSLALLGVGR